MWLALVLACGGDAEEEDGIFAISDGDLSGVVGGEAWSFASGETDSYLSSEEDGFFTSLYTEDLEVCGWETTEQPFVLLSIPYEPGTYPFSGSINATFSPDWGENLVTFDGTLIVDEVTDTTVTAGLYAIYDEDNEVDGWFTVDICE